MGKKSPAVPFSPISRISRDFEENYRQRGMGCTDQISFPQTSDVDSVSSVIETFHMDEPRNKRERKRENYRNIGHAGKLPWTASGIDDCMRHIHKRRLVLKKEEREDWDP